MKYDVDSLYDEYLGFDMFKDDDDKLVLLDAINQLSEVDKRILVMYAEIGNLRDLGVALNVSTPTIWKRVKAIKEQVLNNLC